jgi:hypothetical protein
MIPPEILTPLIVALVGALAAFLERIRRDLAANTAATQQAQQAAAKSEQASNGRLTEQIKLNQDLQRENYTLRRLIDALEMDKSGLEALAIARARLETLRVVRPGSQGGPDAAARA